MDNEAKGGSTLTQPLVLLWAAVGVVALILLVTTFKDGYAPLWVNLLGLGWMLTGVAGLVVRLTR